MNWTSADIEKATKSERKRPATPRKPPASTTEPPQASRVPQGQEITFPGVVPGLNGKGGLLRMHWTRRAALLAAYMIRVKQHRRVVFTGPVRLELIRYSTGRDMDYENLVSTGKLPTDALVRCGILPDDNPTIIAERSYTQVRAASKDAQRTVIRLTDLATPTISL